MSRLLGESQVVEAEESYDMVVMEVSRGSGGLLGVALVTLFRMDAASRDTSITLDLSRGLSSIVSEGRKGRESVVCSIMTASLTGRSAVSFPHRRGRESNPEIHRFGGLAAPSPTKDVAHNLLGRFVAWIVNHLC